MKIYILTLTAILNILFAEFYTDRFLVYINNSETNFMLNEEIGRTNHKELNQKLDDVSALNIHQWLFNARATDRDGDIYLNRYYVVQFAENRQDIEWLVKSFLELSCITQSETMTINRPTYVPNDTRWNQQYGLHIIEADLAYDLWDIEGGEIPGQMSEGEIVVGVADDACDWDHPDLIQNIWQNLGEDADGDGTVLEGQGNSWDFDPQDINGIDDDGDGYVDNFIGWDFTGGGDNDPIYPSSSLSHGTSVAGCVSSMTNNSTGVASVGWSVKIMPFRCSDSGQYIDYGYNGILAAAQMGANVINCSWGGFGGGNQSVINTAYNTYGCIVVASAGNGGSDGNTNFDFHSPSGLTNVLSVTATGPNDNFGCWATGGETVDLSAPGENIWTTNLGGGYGSAWGTSFSSPITAGAAALVWSRFPSMTNAQVEERILTNTDYFSDMDGECQAGSLEGMLGTGRLNVYKALSAGVFPSLDISEVNYLNDSDQDGVFNPGESVKIKLVIANEEGWADTDYVVATMTSDDERITIIDSVITFPNGIPSGGSSFTLVDHFLVYAFEDAQLGDVPCLVQIQAGTEEPFYNIEVELDISLSLNQYGFPVDEVQIKSSPLITDVDNNGLNEIFYGADDGKVYGYMLAGYPQAGFPFEAEDNVRSSIAIGDVDSDGNNELVFGSYDNRLYIISALGQQEAVYWQPGIIEGPPALRDLDGDGDLEIIFTTQNGSSGDLFAIHHNGEDVAGFPAEIDEKMRVGPAVGDLDDDGVVDIVIVTWDDNIYALDAFGNIKSGFPVTSTNRFNCAPTLADLDGNGTLEIIAGNDSGLLHVLFHDGSEMVTFDTGDDIRGGISVSDLNNDGSLEILFSGYDDMVHVWNPFSEEELEGWPIDMGSNSLTGPITADLDNDGDLEVIAAIKSGTVYVLHHDGSPFSGFPANLPGTIESTPAIGDLDEDNNYELIFGTTQGLQVLDIKSDKGDLESWKMHRSNAYRTGTYGASFLSINQNNGSLPKEFKVSSNYPNPFNPSTKIDVEIAKRSHLDISVFDLNGRLISNIYNNNQLPGVYTFTWSGKDKTGQPVSSGVYFIQVKSGLNLHSQKVAFMK